MRLPRVRSYQQRACGALVQFFLGKLRPESLSSGRAPTKMPLSTDTASLRNWRVLRSLCLDELRTRLGRTLPTWREHERLGVGGRE
eukprot:6182140-Pleurochrysis_carterae.AAC.2